MEAAGGRVGATAELSAGMQLGHDDLDAGQAGLGLDVHGDAAAVVPDLDGGVLVEDHLDVVAVATQGLVDGIVDDLPQAVHEAPAVGRADIHAGTLADGLQPLEDEQVPRGVVGTVPVCSGQQRAGRHGRVGGHAVRSSLNFFSGPVGRRGGSGAARRVPSQVEPMQRHPRAVLSLVQIRTGVRSPGRVKETSRSLPRMNHLGFGHVLMNNLALTPGRMELQEAHE